MGPEVETPADSSVEEDQHEIKEQLPRSTEGNDLVIGMQPDKRVSGGCCCWEHSVHCGGGRLLLEGGLISLQLTSLIVNQTSG